MSQQRVTGRRAAKPADPPIPAEKLLAGDANTEGRGAEAILRELPSASGGVGTAAAAAGVQSPAGSAIGGEATRELAGSGGGAGTGIGPIGVGAARAARIARAPVGDDAEIATRAGEAGTVLGSHSGTHGGE